MSRAQEPWLETDPRSLERAADDWGHLVRRRPRGVVRPGSVQELVAAVRRWSLVPRGNGHSSAGQAQTDGIVIPPARVNPIQSSLLVSNFRPLCSVSWSGIWITG